MEVYVYLTMGRKNNVDKIMARLRELGLTDLSYDDYNRKITTTYNGEKENLNNLAETINTEFGKSIDSMASL